MSEIEIQYVKIKIFLIDRNDRYKGIKNLILNNIVLSKNTL